MALTLISLLALSAYAFGTAQGLVQKSIFHQFTPVPKTNTRYACWYTANICKSHRGNETLTYIICLNETCQPVLILGSHTNRWACGRVGDMVPITEWHSSTYVTRNQGGDASNLLIWWQWGGGVVSCMYVGGCWCLYRSICGCVFMHGGARGPAQMCLFGSHPYLSLLASFYDKSLPLAPKTLWFG